MYQEHELAVIKDNGIRNGLTVNYELINSKKYHDKFIHLTAKKEVNEALYSAALTILGNRSGTEFEEIIAVDGRTGKWLAHNLETVIKKYPYQCGFSVQEQ